MDGEPLEQRLRACLAGPLRALLDEDGGAAEFVALEGNKCTIRVTGRFRGCPGTPLVVDEIIAPMLTQAAGTKIDVVVRAF